MTRDSLSISISESTLIVYKVAFVPVTGLYCNFLVLRSAGKTSAGLKDVECSIMDAYSEMITLSKRFIYIENQFFVSDALKTASPESTSRIQNKIAYDIASRIIIAFEKGEDFKVYIVLPETAGFLGKFEDRNCPEQELFFHLQVCHSIGKISIAILAPWSNTRRELNQTSARIAQIAVEKNRKNHVRQVHFYRFIPQMGAEKQ